MINRILIELYEEYEKTKTIDKVKEFAIKTFPNDGTSDFFVGCVAIMFDMAKGAFKPKYDCTRERLVSIVVLAKERVVNSNLLTFYLERVNEKKGICKYFSKLDSSEFEKYADVILDYLEGFKPDMIKGLKSMESYKRYVDSLENKESK